jgi:hypothetical protein
MNMSASHHRLCWAYFIVMTDANVPQGRRERDRIDYWISNVTKDAITDSEFLNGHAFSTLPIPDSPSPTCRKRRAPDDESDIIGNSSSDYTSEIPVKTQALVGLAKPVLFKDLFAPMHQLPSDVQLLYQRIHSIAFYHANYLPAQDRAKISSIIGDIPDYSFHNGGAGDFDTLQEILFASQECQKLGRSEPSWNMLVHAPLLKTALKNHHYVDEELMHWARICRPFMPPLEEIGDRHGALTGGKIVDLAMVLTPAEEGSRASGRKPKGNKRDTARDKTLLRAIQSNVLRGEPMDTQGVNQTTYTPVMFRPIATAMATKAEGGAEEGKVQLGIWTWAWHRRMVALRTLIGPGRVGSKIVTVPLILVLGHQWKLLFACDAGDSLDILGDVPIGDTCTLLGLYTVVAVLRELADWIEGPFRDWIMHLFKIDEDHDESDPDLW